MILCPWKVLAGRITLAFIIVAGLQAQSLAQQTPRPPAVKFDEMPQILTGETTRTWIYEHTDVIQGTSDECSQGDVYRFATDHSVVWEHCENGHIKEDQHRWTLSQDNRFNVILTIDDQRYTVLIKQTTTGWKLKLRKPSESKTVPTIDKDYYYKAE
jgi:hypothetical protein